MSKILLIEPSRMLQHAFVCALFPEHDVEIVAELESASTHSSGVDLAIIDVAALRQRNAATKEPAEVSLGWELPTLWIDSTSTSSAASRTAQLTLPFSKEELRAAVAKLLQSAPAVNQVNPGDAHRQAAAPRRGKSPKPVASPSESDKKIIELVEVFEEGDQHKDDSTDAGSRN